MATLILIDGDAELLRARALVDQLWNSTHPGDFARLEAQARLVAAYEEMKWPRRPPSVADLIRHLISAASPELLRLRRSRHHVPRVKPRRWGHRRRRRVGVDRSRSMPRRA